MPFSIDSAYFNLGSLYIVEMILDLKNSVIAPHTFMADSRKEKVEQLKRKRVGL